MTVCRRGSLELPAPCIVFDPLNFRSWVWSRMSPYNGFTHEERVLGWQVIDALIEKGELAPAVRCSVTGSRSDLQYHCENYYEPWAPIPICREAHFALHRRFREPAAWVAIMSRYARQADDWFCPCPLRQSIWRGLQGFGKGRTLPMCLVAFTEVTEH